VANAVAGAAALSNFGGYDTSLRWVSGGDDASGAAWKRVRLQAEGASDYEEFCALSYAESRSAKFLRRM